MTDLETWATALRDGGFVFVHAPAMAGVLAGAGLADWDGFARSWDDLGLDTYMADGGRYRKTSARGICRLGRGRHAEGGPARTTKAVTSMR